MRFHPLGLTILLCVAVTSPGTASGEEPGNLHTNDGLPPIGEPGKAHGYTGPGCSPSFEKLSLVLDRVTLDGVDGPLVTDVRGEAVPVSAITESDLRVETTTEYVDFELKLAPAFAADSGIPDWTAVFHAQ